MLGFSLVELVVVLAVAALLMTLATPSYQRYLDRAHRTEAIAHMLSIAGCQERIRSLNGNYDHSRCLPEPGERYTFAFSDARDHGFMLVAQPRARQSDDPCGSLMLDHLGQRHVGAAGADVYRCWTGR